MGNRKNEAVILRQKPMKNGGYSLFLDINKNGKRKKEYTKLHLVPEVTKADRLRNKQTLQLAKAVAAKRLIEVHNDEYGFSQNVRMGIVELYDDFVAERSKRDVRENTIKCYKPLRTYFVEYGWEDKDASELTSDEINSFICHLRKKGYSSCTLSQTLSRVRQFLNFGIRKGAINHRAADDMQKIQPQPKLREYLTISEVRAMAKTEATNNNVKNAFLFSCLTGLRKCDIIALKWGQICEENEMTRLIFTQRKTKGQMYLDITPEAVKYLGERKGADDFVFRIPTPHTIQDILDKWIGKAGIAKRLTFHCARHTFATMMLELDVDIYVVSKLLGHSSVSTTQVYAKVVDKSKQNAVLRIPTIS